MPSEFKTLPLSNSFMFGEVMRNKEICKLFLEKLLECTIERIEFINKEADIADSPYNHGIHLDVFFADENHTHYDVEMQNSKDSLERRSRYYQSGIDRRLLEHGAHFDELPQSYVIFVCNYDPVGLGRAKYERQSFYKDSELEYDDGSHVIFLNTKYKTTEGVSHDIIEFLDYVRNDREDQVYTSELAQSAKTLTEKIRHDETKEVSYMTYREALYDEFRRGEMAGEAQGEARTLKSIIQQLLQKLPLDDVARLLNMTPESISKMNMSSDI